MPPPEKKKTVKLGSLRLLGVAIGFLLATNGAQAQPSLDSLLIMYDTYVDDYDSAGFAYFKPNMLTPGQPYAMWQAAMPDSLHQLELKKTWQDNIVGMRHYRYQETYKNLKVEAAEYSEHANADGYLEFANGKAAYFNSDEPPSAEPEISKKKSLDLLLSKYPEHEFAWQNADWEQDLRIQTGDSSATYYPEGELMWALDSYHNLNWEIPTNRYSLAWRFDIISISPNFFHKAFYVDAQTGAILREEQLVHSNGPANILNQGSKVIDCDYKGAATNAYILKTDNKGRDIHTKTDNTFAWFVTSNVTDQDHNWGYDHQQATTSHWSVSQSWDFFNDFFGIDGMDSQKANVRVWSGSGLGGSYDHTAVGDYINIGYGYNTIDVAGHEYTHGIDEYWATLTYSAEPGALDESFADIFGFMIERYAEGGISDWLIGENAVTTRSLSEPKQYGSHFINPQNCLAGTAVGQPNTYGGQYWYPTSSQCDNRGVHVNSGVQNYWFYLLAHGGSGTNDNNNNYNIQGIGAEKAALIAGDAHQNILMSGAQYQDARAATVTSALDIYGHCSIEYVSTMNAWAAVGIGIKANCGTVSLDQNDNNVPKVFPNPVDDQLTVQFKDLPPQKLVLISIDGQIVKEINKQSSSSLVIDMTNLSKGLYILKMNFDDEVETRKIIKK